MASIIGKVMLLLVLLLQDTSDDNVCPHKMVNSELQLQLTQTPPGQREILVILHYTKACPCSVVAAQPRHLLTLFAQHMQTATSYDADNMNSEIIVLNLRDNWKTPAQEHSSRKN